MKPSTTKVATPILAEEAPLTTFSRLIEKVPSTQMFAGWGPRIKV